MITQAIWWLVAGLVVCELPALVLCYRWYHLAETGRAPGATRWFSHQVTLQLSQRLIVLLFGSFPALAILLALFSRWPAPVAFTGELAPLLVIPVLAGLLLFVGVLGASLLVVGLLLHQWDAFRCAFFLPEDADRVRLNGLRQGIIAAARAYPQPLFQQDEEFDLAVRMGEVMFKARRFPNQQQRWRFRLTNDFARYCDLMRDGYRVGYQRFFAECRDAADQMTGIREHLNQPQVKGAKQTLVDQYATRYLSLE